MMITIGLKGLTVLAVIFFWPKKAQEREIG